MISGGRADERTGESWLDRELGAAGNLRQYSALVVVDRCDVGVCGAGTYVRGMPPAYCNYYELKFARSPDPEERPSERSKDTRTHPVRFSFFYHMILPHDFATRHQRQVQRSEKKCSQSTFFYIPLFSFSCFSFTFLSYIKIMWNPWTNMIMCIYRCE